MCTQRKLFPIVSDISYELTYSAVYGPKEGNRYLASKRQSDLMGTMEPAYNPKHIRRLRQGNCNFKTTLCNLERAHLK